jgi:hypothetical protein
VTARGRGFGCNISNTSSNLQVLAPEHVHFVAVSFTPYGDYMMSVRADKCETNFRFAYDFGFVRKLSIFIDKQIFPR